MFFYPNRMMLIESLLLLSSCIQMAFSAIGLPSLMAASSSSNDQQQRANNLNNYWEVPQNDPKTFWNWESMLGDQEGPMRFQASQESNALFDKFFGRDANYSKYTLPKQKVAGSAITVNLLLTLIQVGDVDERNQIMSTMIWVNHKWQDMALAWDPNLYGGLEKLHVPSELIWIPDTVLYNKLVY